ncbi:MAG: hypothetical protein M1475_00080 [Actinobacteria bacterium]|nr:hypothetical protein [Actinomycetota bacterium]
MKYVNISVAINNNIDKNGGNILTEKNISFDDYAPADIAKRVEAAGVRFFLMFLV